MSRSSCYVLVFLLLWLWGVNDSEAGELRRWRAESRSRPVPADTWYYGPVQGLGIPMTARPWQYHRGRYPKYFGAFHAREMQNLGVPTGDIGLRGNGIFWSPW